MAAALNITVDMQNAIKQEIKKISKKIIAKIAYSQKTEKKFQRQFEKRTGMSAGQPKPKLKNKKPNHYEPIFCLKNANFLAKSLWHKIQTQQYEPDPAINYKIPKPDGSKRSIMEFSIIDAAVANVILRRTINRNRKRLSASSYAYHPDKNLFDAILALKDYKPNGKLFSVQIDFEKYFDNIPTRYVVKKIEDKETISLTPQEIYVFKAFLKHRYAELKNISSGPFSKRHRGTPQGSSASLILANIANHELDKDLTNKPGAFVRFADDVVALCDNYGDAQDLENCFAAHCKNSGLLINREKSPGIAVISDIPAEIRTSPHFDYLGYRFTQNGLTIPDRSKERIKSKISNLANLYLINYIKIGHNHNRCGTNPHQFDWDLLGLISELRNYLYGGLSERNITEFLQGGSKLRRMRGLMGFYCLIDDPRPLKEIDGWMLSILRRAMSKRNQLLQSKYGRSCPTPTNKALATGTWLDFAMWRGSNPPETRVPSLVRGWRAARKHYFSYGLEGVEAPNYGNYRAGKALFDY